MCLCHRLCVITDLFRRPPYESKYDHKALTGIWKLRWDIFSYICVSRDVFHIGLTNIVKDGFSFIIATPEKALCDLIANSSKVNLRYLNEVREYLENDIRLDMDAFHQMNPEIFREYVGVGKKSSSISTIIKL